MIEVVLKIEYGDEENLCGLLSDKIGVTVTEANSPKIIRKTADFSDGKKLYYRTTVSLTLSEKDERRLCRKYGFVREAEDLVYRIPDNRTKSRPVVIGSGPAGLFAALILAEAGACPLVIERGGNVDERLEAVRKFESEGVLSPDSNIQFGEGGAGAFSDGKLKAGRLDALKQKILEEFVAAGAPEDILVRSDAHIGTDLLPSVVKRIREKIVALGGSVVFHNKLTGISVKGGRLDSLITEKGEIAADCAVLATGHSARDVFALLMRSGAVLEPKGFGIGVRAEHPQKLIDRLIYGDLCGHPALDAASYHLVEHLPSGRSVYSFCMCPGGSVVAATSEEGSVVTNGMSPFARNGRNANAALLVSVTPEDFGGTPLGGIELQQSLERAAFVSGGSGYKAPGERMEDFLECKVPKGPGSVIPTYALGVTSAPLESFMPGFLTNALREAIPLFDAYMPGYYMPDAWLTGVESRSTSPVRVVRDGNLQAVGISGLFPCGEGAGYAGGILSAAVDGIRCAEKILSGVLS